MKKKIFGMFIIALALVAPMFLGGFYNEKAMTAEADLVLHDIYALPTGTGNYRLTKDLKINDEISPISFDDGYFDGNGHTITIDGGEFETDIFNQNGFMGIFGNVTNATIKNVKIICNNVRLDFGFDVSYSEYVFGVLLGKGSGVTIENCEINGTIFAGQKETLGSNIATKTTFGGIAGKLDAGSVVKNCAVNLDCEFVFELENQYVNKIGGITGELCGASKLEYCVGYNEFSVENKNHLVACEIHQGGLVGNMNGQVTKILNSASTTNFHNTMLAGDTAYTGGLIGSITNVKPTSGNIASCGYAYTITENSVTSQGEKFYGNSAEVVYNFSNEIIKDYVVKVPAAILGVKDFFATDDYNSYGVEWYNNYWDFGSTWMVVGDEILLQQFQKFTIKLKEDVTGNIDNNGVLESKTVVEETHPYGDNIEFVIQFKADDPSAETKNEYEKYYQILDILHDETSLNLSGFAKEGNKRISKNGNLSFEKQEAEGQPTKYIFTIKSEQSTAGEYSFKTSLVQFSGFVVASDGGKVSSSKTTSIVADYLQPKQLTKDSNPYEIKAIPSYQNRFLKWTLWTQVDKATHDAGVADEAQKANFFAFSYPDGITGEPIHTYWTLATGLDETIIGSFNSSEYRVQFGTAPFTQNFLMKASFVKSTYKLGLGQMDIKRINKIEVMYNSNTQSYVFDANSSVKDLIELDQSETITIKVYVKKGFNLDDSSFPAKMKVSLADKNQVEENGEQNTVYTYLVSTVNLKSLVNSEDTFAFSVQAVKDLEQEKKQNSMTLIIGIGGGVVGLTVVIIVVVVIVKKRGGGGGAAKKAKKVKDDQFKQFYG